MPEWLSIAEAVARIVLALMTPVLGCLAYTIARRQANIARDKLKLDLFERRYAVYLSVNEWINDLQRRVVPDAEYTAHIRKMEQAQFLFDKDVNDWLRELRKKARSMNHARRLCGETRAEGEASTGHARIVEASNIYSELTLDFDKELERATPIFARYLDFSKNL